MKLSEALILRADSQTKISQVRQRLLNVAKIQEGETPPEDPQALLQELNELFNHLESLIRRINRTNSLSEIQPGMTLSDALAKRDVLPMRRKMLNSLADSASTQQSRYSRSEIKYCSTVDVRQIQTEIDSLSKQYRELDTQIQAMNWQVELLD